MEYFLGALAFVFFLAFLISKSKVAAKCARAYAEGCEEGRVDGYGEGYNASTAEHKAVLAKKKAAKKS